MAAMAVDSRQQLSGMPYDTMRYQTPQFTNPWAAVSGAAQGQLYATSMNHAVAPDQARHSMNMGAQQPTASTMAYPTSSLPALSMASGAQHMADPSIYMGQDSPLQGYAAARPYGADYSMPAGTTAGSYGPSVPAPYAAPGYMPVDQTKLAPFGTMHDRRSSHPSVVSNSFLSSPADAMRYRQSSLIDMDNRMQSATDAERNSFSDALDASRGMVAMSQDITPRNIYGNQGSARSSTDSYGFPLSHSSHSSISSASTYPSYYGGSSVSEASYGDYSSASESVDIPSRRLPRPRVGSGSGSGGSTVPPAPQSMMSQFSSKVSSSSQKKHKCKVCDKRFTRPSSLQTHMYSHTGEKPFACDVDGCGRHFSVVSNLRRHKKVHKGQGDHLSPDDDE